jgi:hypothetical protein
MGVKAAGRQFLSGCARIFAMMRLVRPTAVVQRKTCDEMLLRMIRKLR